MADYVCNICNSLPQIVIPAGIIAAGIYLLTQQKKKLETGNQNKNEHYWEPYRPYQQLTEKPVHTSDNSDKDTASEASSITDPENTESGSPGFIHKITEKKRSTASFLTMDLFYMI